MYGGVAEPEARARDRQARIQASEVGREESIAGRPGSTCSAALLPRNRWPPCAYRVSAMCVIKATHRPQLLQVSGQTDHLLT